jgi:deoxycytidine triphosphate deaminase
MLIVGENLKALIEQHNIISDKKSFDETSLSLTLDREVIYYEPDGECEITYGNAIPKDWIKKARIPDEGFILRPNTCVLGCSRETIRMPLGYFGLIQTKGTLARLFVSVTSCDGQVEAGFSGKVTLEIANVSNFSIRFLPNQKVAQLFILKTSTKAVKPYNGRYQGAQGPTISLPEE